MEERNQMNYGDLNNNDIEKMVLTDVGGNVLPDSQSLEICVQVEKRLNSMKRIPFWDEYDNSIKSSTTIFSSSRTMMMEKVENNSNLSTSDLIHTGLKRLECIVSRTNPSNSNCRSPDSRSSAMSDDSYYSVSNYDPCSTSNEMISFERRDSNSSLNRSGSSSSSGIFSALANMVRNIMRNFPGMGTSKNIETEQISTQNDIASRPFTSETFNPMSNLTSSLARRPGKAPRDTFESTSSLQKQVDCAVPQIGPRTSLVNPHLEWHQIKGRKPIARMRNSRLTSPRGVSSETQIFHQGLLSVGDTILPLPSRAHKYTQT